MSTGSSTQHRAPHVTKADGSMVRVLVVDDEHSLTELLKMALKYEGWDVRTAADGLGAVKAAREFRPDAIVLDIMLPDIDGLEVLQRVRAEGTETPVLFLTAKDSLDDRIAGLTAGGDDYVTKPFSLEEVVARLRGLIRRSTLTLAQTKDPVLTVGDLTLDEDSYEVARASTPIEQILSGKVAGVTVTRAADGGLVMRIRGAASLTGPEEPLYVVDGTPITPGPGGSLTGVNPYDIESISVLKDAASLTMYGSRGANGVILIKTKNAKRR